MIWTVDAAAVSRELKELPMVARPYWDACVGELERNPRPRQGYFLERVSSLGNSTLKTYLYEITEEVSISGEKLYVLTAEFFPFYIPVYRLNESARNVVIIYLRENHLV